MKIALFPWARGMREPKPHPKNYPYWPELVAALQAKGHTLVQYGVAGEQQLVPEFHPNLPLVKLEEELRGCNTWIGIDSFGQHFCWSIGIRGIVLFGQSDPVIFGHPENINLLKDRSYLREKQFWLWEQAEADPDAFVEPAVVLAALEANFHD